MIKEQYRLSFDFLRGPLYSFLKNTCLAFCIIFFISLIASLLFPVVLDTLMSYINAVIQSADIMNNDGTFSTANILSNNIRASFLSILYGFLPIIYLPALPIGLNSSILGAMTASYIGNGQSMLLLAAGIVPHGIFEFPALFLSFACGLYLCHEMTALIRHQENRTPLPETLISLVRVFVLVILPLLLAASVIEANITPLCMMPFL